MAYSNSKLSKESGREVSHCTGEVTIGADKGEVESGPGLGSLIDIDVFGLIEMKIGCLICMVVDRFLAQ